MSADTKELLKEWNAYCETLLEFKPEKDITAYESAQIFGHFGTILPGFQVEHRKFFHLDGSWLRHFKAVEWPDLELSWGAGDD